jgi:tetratricopeptide (TPR) repeat protein
MKKIMGFLFLLFIMAHADAQGINDGRMMFLYGRHASADRMFNETVKADPTNADGWYWLVRNSLAADSLDRAKKYAASIPPGIKEEPYIQVAIGSVLLYENDSLAATALFDAALGTKRKKDPFVQLAIAAAYNDAPKSNHQKAVELLEAARKREGKNAEILTALGDAHRWMYDGSSAYRAYEEAIAVNGKYADAFYKQGKIFQTQNNAEMFLRYYQQAVDADSNYAPAYYELFRYNYNRNKAAEAFGYLQKYMAHADPRVANEYLLADMLLMNKQYSEAIAQSNRIIAAEKEKTRPTVYRLIAFASKELGDLAKSESYINTYFSLQPDSLERASDHELLASIYEKTNRDSLALDVYQKAFALQKDSTIKLKYATNLAASYKKKKEFQNEALWDEQVYRLKKNATNVDLYNWGIASYNSKDYETSDSVFALYEEKYPQHVYGYYWRARSNEAIDTSMEKGIAVPHYLKLIDVAITDTANATNKRWLIQAYSYVAAYKANTEKDYEEAIDYFDKVLELSPENEQVIKYKQVLEKMLAKDKETGQNEQQSKAN